MKTAKEIYVDNKVRTVLEIDVWSRSATRKEWFLITRRIIQDTITDLNLDLAAEAKVIEAFTGAGLL